MTEKTESKSRLRGVEALKEIALDTNLSREERLNAHALILATSLADRNSAFNTLGELARKAPTPSERLNAQDYLRRIIALDTMDELR